MSIPFSKIPSAPIINSNAYVDIPGLIIDLPPASGDKKEALVILNVPMPYAQGNNFPGINFAIEANQSVVAEGGFTYTEQTPASFARIPFTLVTKVSLTNQHIHIKAQWSTVRGSTAHIDSYACISAVIG